MVVSVLDFILTDEPPMFKGYFSINQSDQEIQPGLLAL